MKKYLYLLIVLFGISGCIPQTQDEDANSRVQVQTVSSEVEQNYQKIAENIWLAKKVETNNVQEVPIYQQKLDVKLDEQIQILQKWLGAQAKIEKRIEDNHEQTYIVKEGVAYQLGKTPDGYFLDINSANGNVMNSMLSNLDFDQERGNIQITDFTGEVSFSAEAALK